MALIKCSECGQDVSDETLSCPHCGKTIGVNLLLIEKALPPPLVLKNLKQNKEKSSLKEILQLIIAIFCLLGLSTIIFFFLEIYLKDIETNYNQLITSYLNQPTPTLNNSLNIQISDSGKKIYPVQYNKLWGHEFFTSKIDQTGNIDIGLAAKQTIAKLLNSLDFPPKLTKNLVIVNIDATLVGSNVLIKIPWIEGISAFAIIQQLEGGLYGTLGNGTVIFLNNLVGYDLAVLTHELGHLIANRLTDQEWTQYYKLRGIPDNTPRRSSNWSLSPEEDLAEVYKATYEPSVVGSGEYSMEEDKWTIKTKYGFFVPTKYTYSSSCDLIQEGVISDLLNTWRKNILSYQMDYYIPPNDVMNKLQDQASADPKVQSCRKKNNELSPFGGPAFISQADPETQQFIKNVITRLNSM